MMPVLPRGSGRAGGLRLPLRWQWAGFAGSATLAVAVLVALVCASVAGLAGIGATLPFAVAAVAALAIAAAAYFYARSIEARIDLAATQLLRAANEAGENHSAAGSRPGAEAADETVLARLDDATRAVSRSLRSLAVERRHSRDLVDREGQAKVQFLAAMSHELRTPLNAILGYSTLLLEDAVDRGDRAASGDLERIGAAGRRLLGLIDNLLELSGMQSDRGGVHRALASLAEIVALAHTEVEGSRDLADRVEIAELDDQILLVTDTKRCVRAIRNLLDAALSHSEGRVILVGAQDAAAGKLNVTIACPGWKVAAPALDNLFDGPGGQTAAKHNRELVSLAVARSLARSLGGDCHAQFRPQGGIELIFALPLDANARESAPAGERHPVAALERQLELAAAHGGTRTVLVIDDDLAAIDLLGRWLRRLDCFVLEARSAADGLVLAREAKPDFVLLDALMPERTGYDVLAEMRNDPELRDTPVVLVTVDDDRVRGLDAGASDFIRKPISEAQLSAVVKTYGETASGDILVIDDDEDAAEIMCRNLERLGFSSARAVDGEQGLRIARAQRPSAIVLDLRMPRIDGFAFIEQIAKDPDLSTVPVIVVSGLDLSLAQHHKLSQAGYRFYSKGQTAPREIADILKELVA